MVVVMEALVMVVTEMVVAMMAGDGGDGDGSGDGW